MASESEFGHHRPWPKIQIPSKNGRERYRKANNATPIQRNTANTTTTPPRQQQDSPRMMEKRFGW